MATTITKEITLDLLNSNSVSVKTVEKAKVNLVERTIGTYRKAYVNSPIGRQQIIDDLSEQYANAVLAVWGDEPTVTDPAAPVNSESEGT